jgi:translation initiation factor RLI1
MERLIKYALAKAYNPYTGKYEDITKLRDLLVNFSSIELEIIFETAEAADISLETLVQYAKEVVQELKADIKEKAKGVLSA